MRERLQGKTMFSSHSVRAGQFLGGGESKVMLKSLRLPLGGLLMGQITWGVQ